LINSLKSRFDNLSRKSVRVVKYKGKGKFETEKDVIGKFGYGNGFERLLNYLSGLLPSNEVIGNAIRRDVLMYPPLTLRELVANAIIHQDFRERGTSVIVEIYEDRVRACYQHAAIMHVTNQRMTNQSLRDRFKIEEQNAAVVSRVIRHALDERFIKPEDPDSKSRKFVRYLLFGLDFKCKKQPLSIGGAFCIFRITKTSFCILSRN
jgi:predicted HTH transcriptional regulator